MRRWNKVAKERRDVHAEEEQQQGKHLSVRGVDGGRKNVVIPVKEEK